MAAGCGGTAPAVLEEVPSNAAALEGVGVLESTIMPSPEFIDTAMDIGSAMPEILPRRTRAVKPLARKASRPLRVYINTTFAQTPGPWAVCLRHLSNAGAAQVLQPGSRYPR